jgi:cytidylate kinase
VYVDTGAMYRAVTLFCLQNGLIDGEGRVLSEQLVARLGEISIEFRANGDCADTYLNGRNVEDGIRSIEIAAKVSIVSAIPEVRAALVRQQQAMGRQKGVVMDGRDIGTVVFPDAELKVFMTASPEIRARRRYLELQAKGATTSLDEVRRNLDERDYIDSHRATSPLTKADDAVTLDNSSMTPDEQVEWLYKKAKERCGSIES